MSRSALQTTAEVTLLKERADTDMCRTLKNEEFADWLKRAGLRKASSQQDMSATLINSALQVGKHLQGDEVVPIIRDIENKNKYGTKSCFNDMTKLHSICTKVSPNSIGFVIRCIHDWITRGKIEHEDISKKALLGHSGLLTLFEVKLNLLDYWVVSVMPRAKILEKDRLAIKKALESHEQCREMVWGRDVPWQGTLQRSSQETLQFIEDSNLN